MLILRAHDLFENEINFNLDDFIVECRFNSIQCSKRLIESISSPEFDAMGIEFNLKEDVKIPGPAFGLEMILNVQQDEYVPFFSRSAGVKVVIGEGEVFDVPTGFDVDIGLSTVVYTRLPGKTGRCSDSEISIAYCFQNCTYYSAVCSCNCRWKTWSCNGMYEDSCLTFKDFECIDNEVYFSSINGDCSYCRVPCHELTYRRTVSMSKWPAYSYAPILENKLSKKNISIAQSVNDLVSVRVYFSSLIVENEFEVYSYTVINLVSDIGGQLGLWIGVSILSLLEVLELTSLFTLNICQRKKNQVSQTEEGTSKLETDQYHNQDMIHVQDLSM
ncbi:degenerin unc-8-like [Pecten maximus]|uniref:degenerin unc-8-like n=1 Tax=Pecten maximus TaxID=6579 RepID=UPI001459117D|nr:degenerin unc-8-like [Pecten maximus]